MDKDWLHCSNFSFVAFAAESLWRWWGGWNVEGMKWSVLERQRHPAECASAKNFTNSPRFSKTCARAFSTHNANPSKAQFHPQIKPLKTGAMQSAQWCRIGRGKPQVQWFYANLSFRSSRAGDMLIKPCECCTVQRLVLCVDFSVQQTIEWKYLLQCTAVYR